MKIPFTSFRVVSFLLALVLAPAGLRAIEINPQLTAGYTSRIDGSGSDEIFDSFADPTGNVYVVGRTSSVTGTIDVLRALAASPAGTEGTTSDVNRTRFGPDTQQTMPGSAGTYSTRTFLYSLFVIKYDRDGRVVWKRTASGNPGDNYGGYDYVATGVAADASGNVFITGSIAGEASFGPFTVSPSDTFSVAGGGGGNIQSNLFVAMLDRDGNWQWVKPMTARVYNTDDNGTSVHTPTSTVQLFLRNGGAVASAYTTSNGGYLAPPTTPTARGNGTPDGHALALGPDGSVYIKGNVELGTEVSPGDNTFTQIYWLNINGNTADTRPNNRVAIGAAYGTGSSRRSVLYQNTAFLAKLKATPSITPGATPTYSWDWLAPVTSGVVQTASGSTSDANIDKGVSYLYGQGTSHYYSNTTSVIGQIAVDDSSVYLTGTWKGKNVLSGGSVTPYINQEGYVARLNSGNGQPIYLAGYYTDRALTSGYAGGLTIDEQHNAYVTGAVGNNDTTAVTKFRGRTLTDSAFLETDFGVPVNQQNFFVAKLNASGDWLWTLSPYLAANSGATYAWATSMSRDAAGALYLGGTLYSATTTSAPNYFTLAGQDVFGSRQSGNTAFVAKVVDVNGNRSCPWTLQTWPGPTTGGTAPSFDTADVHAGLGGTIYWAVDSSSAAPIANARSTTAADNAYDSVTGRGAFLLPVLADTPYLSPNFASFTTVRCGQEVVPPNGAYKDPVTLRPLQPEVVLPGTTTPAAGFYWDNFGKKLFAVSQTVAEIRWRTTTDPLSTTRLSAITATRWPTTAEGLITHVTGAGTNGDEPAVSLEPANGGNTFSSVLYTESNALVSGAKLFNAKGEGYSVLLYSAGNNSAPTSAAVSLVVVRSYLWTNAAVRSTDTATVGVALDPAAHNHTDPEGKSGYVVNRRARIDANGSAAAYSFDTRRGPIIPVNVEELTTATPPADADALDDLWVIWSNVSTAGKGVAWPAQAVRYTTAWPTTPEKIVIASQLGSEMEVSGATATRAFGCGSSTLFSTPTADGVYWGADESFSGGTTYGDFATPIAGTDGTVTGFQIYATGRRGAAFTYNITVPNGQYTVSLHFAQPISTTKFGINLSVEGVPVLTNLNVAERAGSTNAALVIKVPVTVTDGNATLTFTAPTGTDMAFVNAIKLIPAQEKLDPAKFTNLAVYHQPDKTLAGYNPNEEHALLASPNLPTGITAPGRLSVFALRNDLNNVGIKTSEPYTLVRYQDAADGLKTKFKVYQVVLTDSRYSFASFNGVAGTRILPPYPLSLLPEGAGTSGSGTPYFKDRKNQVWAKSDGTLTARYFYGLQPDFWYDVASPYGVADPGVTAVPWLDRYNKDTLGAANYNIPVATNYTVSWPLGVPTLPVGDTLTSARQGLPDVEQMASATIIYEQSVGAGTLATNNSSVRILDYTARRIVPLTSSPLPVVDGKSLTVGSLSFAVTRDLATGFYRFDNLPFHLKSRLFFAPQGYVDPVSHLPVPALVLAGYKDATSYAGPYPLLLLNVLSFQERARLLNFDNTAGDTGTPWDNAVKALYRLARNPALVAADTTSGPLDGDVNFYAGFDNDLGATALHHANVLGPKALTAGKAAGTNLGYVTLVENNAAGLGALPIALHVLKVTPAPVKGDVKTIFSDNPLDEKITVRHSADFAGDPSGLTFEWYVHDADTGGTPPSSLPPGNGWVRLDAGDGIGTNDVTIEGASLRTLADSWVYCHYKGYSAGGNLPGTFTAYAGDPAATTSARPAFVPGWIKRVLSGLNPFEAKVKDFASAPTQTYSSALVSAGTRYEGDVALNNDPDNLNSLGLIPLYETVLRRGLKLSINGSGQSNTAVNQSLLLAATRISDLYMLWGNEAYADAQDPTVGFTSASGEVGSLAPSVFAFQNEVPSLIEEELALLRGRDNSSAGVGAAPVYNRLFWNFTKGLEGEPVYVQNYSVTDQNADGFINEKDARILYPQGHGDAWGHYLSAVKGHYRLLRHPLYLWAPNSESTLISGVAVEVDYLDERKFAAAAAARANAGAEIVNLTYRDAYTADPAGQWQGYRDVATDGTPATPRAWGVDDWARRAGQGALLDWVTANAILPANHAHLYSNPVVLPSNVGPSTPPPAVNYTTGPTPTGLQKIDRTTVTDLAKIASAFNKVQAQMDQADQGLNPLGVTPGTIPFDIDPNFNEVGSGIQGQTHFEQVYIRTLKAVNNARGVFDYANALTNRLRQTQLSADGFAQDVLEQEHDFNNRLIEIFGYPYAGDTGSGKTYPTGYSGPDLYHYNYVAVNTVSGTAVVPDTQFNAFFAPFAQEFKAPAGGATSATSFQEVYSHYFPNDNVPVNPVLPGTTLPVTFYVSTAASWSFAAPSSWGARRAPGTLQLSIGDMVRAEAELRRGLLDYNNHISAVQDQVDLLFARSGTQAANINVLNRQRNTIIGLNAAIGTLRAVSTATQLGADLVEKIADAAAESLPTVAGVAVDATAPIRGAIKLAGGSAYGALNVSAAVSSIAADAFELSKEQVGLTTDIEIQKNDYAYEIQEQLKVIEAMLREDAGLRIDLFNLQNSLRDAASQYQILLAEGDRLLEERINYRKKVAGVVQQNRYQDLTFRVFRNDALQKYRAAFDLAARYTYLAATTYDYETVQLGSSSAAGRKFLTDIVRERALGQFNASGDPIVGVNGLSDPLARLRQNFDVLKGRLGINNPQIESGQFSLRSENFRIESDSPEAWQDQLQAMRVPDLWAVPEFRRFCRPFAPESAGVQPGLVIPFTTNVNFGLNYFGLPLGPGDSSYDSTNFATKIKAVGVSFTGYDVTGLSSTPRVYLVPVGLDVLRAPDDTTLAMREFDVVDQAIPVPFPVGTAALQNPNWIPSNDSLDSPFNQIRQFSRFRAYPDNGLDTDQLVGDTRLIGRSVWNTRWLLIIPGGTLLNSPTDGLDTFVLGQRVPSSTTGARDGRGVTDIKLFFETYSYSGN